MLSRNVLIGITGGIAAYKIPALVRALRKNGCEVKTVITDAAKTLVGVDALRTLSGSPVYMDGECLYDMDHIRLSEWADVFAICPATANTIAKIAAGVADNLLTTLALSIPQEKILIAPAMNSVMWENKITQANVKKLADCGVDVLPVGVGELACGVVGAGRMVDVEVIADAIISRASSLSSKNLCDDKKSHGEKSLSEKSLDKKSSDNKLSDKLSDKPSDKSSDKKNLNGVRVLISSGPTEEPIDPVRVITNRSSGKMGAALAQAALDMGASVTVVSGPSAKNLPSGAYIIDVRTAAEMERAMTEQFVSADVCIMAAAVSDYRVVNSSDKKIKRDKENITLELTPNTDILQKLGAAKSSQFLVGFSLESGDDDIGRAQEKMSRKKCDMMIFNRVENALGTDDTAFAMLSKDNNIKEISHVSKIDAAKIIIQEITRNIKQKSRS